MEKKHNYGIDLLRIFLMFLIISGHLLTHSGIRENSNIYSDKWVFAWAYQALAFCAVNCFILVTGYFSNTHLSQLKLRKILQLYGQVLFYSVSIYVVLVLCGVIEFSVFDALRACFPVFCGQYWFFSSYILLMLLIPFLNVMLNKLNDFSLKFLTCVIVTVFYIAPIFSIVFMQYDPTEGMGIVAFVTLYIIGHALKRFNIDFSKKTCILGLLINCVVIFVSKVALCFIVNRLGIDAGTGLFYHYNTIFQLLNAIFLLLLFKDIKLKGKIAGASKVAASSVFGIYLLHEHPSIRNFIWNSELCAFLLEVNLPVFICLVFGISIALFVSCFAVDKIRCIVVKMLFKTVWIQKKCEKINVLEENINQVFYD